MAKKAYWGKQRGVDTTTKAFTGGIGAGLATSTVSSPFVGPVAGIALGAGAAYGTSRSIMKRARKPRTARQREASKRNLARARARRKRRH